MSVYRLYHELNVGVSYSYDNFVRDIVSDETFPKETDFISMNAHAVILNKLKSLLANEALVRKYFDKDTFSENDCNALVHEFNLTDNNGINQLSTPPLTLQSKRLPTFGCDLNAVQIELITLTVNNEKIFASEVTSEQMDALLNHSERLPLKSANNRRLALFFHALSQEYLICTRWQSVIGRRHLIISSESNHFLTAKILASTLNEAKASSAYDDYLRNIRRMTREVARLKSNGA